jgi:alpha/beta superfamily hydrolase
MAQLQAIDIPAPHGLLEGLLRTPDPGEARVHAAALVCHPHPAQGGTMHNKVVFRVAQALGELGMPTLRFNFRGVGRSTGVYDEGRGEADDVRTALDELARRFPQMPLWLAGFSFGAWLALPIGCADERVRQLIGVGVPVRPAAIGRQAKGPAGVPLLRADTLEGCAKPKLVVQGELDEHGPLPELRRWFERLPEPKQLTVVPGADHFFTHQQTELRAAVLAYVRSGALALGPLQGR